MDNRRHLHNTHKNNSPKNNNKNCQSSRARNFAAAATATDEKMVEEEDDPQQQQQQIGRPSPASTSGTGGPRSNDENAGVPCYGMENMEMDMGMMVGDNHVVDVGIIEYLRDGDDGPSSVDFKEITDLIPPQGWFCFMIFGTFLPAAFYY
jgi:hypothetical protein